LANAEEAEAALSAEEQELLEMDARAGFRSPVQQVDVPEKGSKDVETEKDDTDNSKATKASAIEVTDEVCKDSEYDLRTNDEPDAEPIAVRGQRSLGGIDYYTVTYDDPTDEDEENY
jgi:hypothetical protein